MPKQDDMQIDPAFQLSWWQKDKPGVKKNPPLAKPPEQTKTEKPKAKNESFRDFLNSRNLN